MNQVSRPMQILLAAVLVFAALWFVALKPGDDAAEPVAAAPAAPVTTTPPAVDAGGKAAQSAPGKVVEAANSVAKQADDAAAKSEQQTGEATPSTTPAAAKPAATTPTSAAKASTPAPTTPAVKAPVATTPKAAKAPAKAASARSRAQRRADNVTEAVGKHLQSRHAVVVLVASTTGSEDKVLRQRVRREIDRRNGRVKVFLIPVSQVGLYDGMLGSLNLGQTPSTIVIAPNNEAKVLGGLVSTARIDRLTSAALLLKPVATK